MTESFSHTVANLDSPVRLYDYLPAKFPQLPSRKSCKKALDKGRVSVDGITASTATWLKGGEWLELQLPAQDPNVRLPDLKLTVHYEDDQLAVVEKPAGLLTSGNKWMTLANALPANLTPSTAPDAVRPQPAHRLDYPTSGVLLAGKTATLLVQLNAMFHGRQIQKTYFAVVIGELPERGQIETDIDGKSALTHYERLVRVASERFGYLSLVRLSPQTGRRHQLRIHLASLGCPILGDREHGREGLILSGKGLYLHATQLVFTHPNTGELITVNSPIPKKMKRIFPDVV